MKNMKTEPSEKQLFTEPQVILLKSQMKCWRMQRSILMNW